MAPGYFVPESNRDRPRTETVDALMLLLPADEVLRVALQTSRFEQSFNVFKFGHVLITDKAIYAAKNKMFGSPKLNVRIDLTAITGFGVGPLYGVGPTWQIEFEGRLAGFFYVQHGPDAEMIGDILGRSLGALSDPDLDHFNRSLDASNRAPSGDLGKEMSPAQVTAEAQKIRRMVATGDLQEAWDRRVALGYGVPSDDVTQADRFWIDADPAIAALKLGLKDHPMVAMCCGVAESNADLRDPEQANAVEEFNHLYHGVPEATDFASLPNSEEDSLLAVPRRRVRASHARLRKPGRSPGRYAR